MNKNLKNILKDTIEGYEKAGSISITERKNRLRQLSREESFREFLDMWNFGYEEEVMKRAVKFKFGKRDYIKTCSGEDLIIHKSIAGRPQDLYDIESIIIRQGSQLDIDYIRKWLKDFSQLLENPEIFDRFEEQWRKLEDGQALSRYFLLTGIQPEPQ